MFSTCLQYCQKEMKIIKKSEFFSKMEHPKRSSSQVGSSLSRKHYIRLQKQILQLIGSTLYSQRKKVLLILTRMTNSGSDLALLRQHCVKCVKYVTCVKCVKYVTCVKCVKCVKCVTYSKLTQCPDLCTQSVLSQWKGSNRKQSARCQQVSRLKASAFYIW